MTVVSEIGETWSPHTAPARTADTEIIIISSCFASGNMATTIGTRIAKVPQLVPVENARNTPTINITAGIITPAEVWEPTTPPTNSASPSVSLTPFKVHAKIRMATAGIIRRNPSTKLSIKPLNVTTFLGRYKTNIKKIVSMVAKIRLVSASQPAKADTTSVAPPKNPVYTIAPIADTISTRTGRIRSYTFPFGHTSSFFTFSNSSAPLVKRSPFFAFSSCFFIRPKSNPVTQI